VNTLLYTLARLAQLQAESLDRVALHEACTAALESAERSGSDEASSPVANALATDPQAQLATVCRHLQVKPAVWLARPDASSVPALLHHRNRGWGILRGQNGQGQWVSEWVDTQAHKWDEAVLDAAALQDTQIARVRLQKPFEATHSPVLRLVKEECWLTRRCCWTPPWVASSST
jgi:ATP-binding cassette subfamily C protein LapB